MMARLRRFESLEAEVLAARREASGATAALRARDLADGCIQTTIGLGNNATCLPGDGGMDIIVARSIESLASQLKASMDGATAFDGPVAFIPVVLFPMVVPDKARPFQAITTREGKPIANLVVGRTFVNNSYAEHWVTNPVTGEKRLISLSGMCFINAAMDLTTGDLADPTSIQDRIDRRGEFLRRTITAHPSTTPAEADAVTPGAVAVMNGYRALAASDIPFRITDRAPTTEDIALGTIPAPST